MDRPFIPMDKWVPAASLLLSPGVPAGRFMDVAFHQLSRLIVWDGRCPGRKVCEAKGTGDG